MLQILKKKTSSILIAAFMVVLSSSVFAQKEPLPPPPPTAPVIPRLFDKNTEHQYLQSLNNILRLQLKKIKRFDKKAYERLLQKTYFNTMDIPFFNKFDKKRMESRKEISSLEIETTSLALTYKNDASADKSKIKKELTEKLNELFTLKEKNKQQDVARLEKKLKDLKRSLAIRNQRKDEIIERRLNELIGDEKYLEWNE